MAEVLVLANETIAGEALLEAIKARGAQGDARFRIVVPKVRPRHGNVIYDETVRDCAQVRIDLALAFLADNDLEGDGEVGDQDPLNATLDALRERPADEIIVSTLPPGQSGWLKKNIVANLEAATGLPVEHIVVDLARDGLPFEVCLVVANLTVSAPELVERLKSLADERPHRLIAVVPQTSVDGGAARDARERLRGLIGSLDEAGIVAAGMIGDPDPQTAILNATDYFRVSEIVISTLPEDTSRWMADKLVERVRAQTDLPVEHIESRVGDAEVQRTP